MNENRVCKRCGKSFSYDYKGTGRKKEVCPDCKSWKKKVFSAYPTQIFDGFPLPDPWGFTKNGSGNIVRWYLGKSVVLYDHHGIFGATINHRSWGKAVFINSKMLALPENVSEGIFWAERKTRELVQLRSA